MSVGPNQWRTSKSRRRPYLVMCCLLQHSFHTSAASHGNIETTSCMRSGYHFSKDSRYAKPNTTKINYNFRKILIRVLTGVFLILQVPIKITENLDPLTLLTDNATIAQWNNENLPSDRMSTENATILTNCERWPLMIDPQLQGVKWIKTREGEELRVVRLGQKGYLLSTLLFAFPCFFSFLFFFFGFIFFSRNSWPWTNILANSFAE